MSNKIYTTNKFYNDGETIMHRGKLTKIGPSIFSFMRVEVGSIIEITCYSLNNNVLKCNKNIVLKDMPTIEIDTPFIVVDKLFVNEGCTKIELIEIRYLTKLELFDELYK
jgi:hypothetical protein